MARLFKQIIIKQYIDRTIEPQLSNSSIDELSQLKYKTSLFWILISNIASFFLAGVIKQPTSSPTYIVFKQTLYVLILFIQCIANHFTTIRIGTLFSIAIQFTGTLYLVMGFMYNFPELLLIGQLAFIGYISLCLVVLFIIQEFAQSYENIVGLIRDYWLAIHLGTFIGQILAMQHSRITINSSQKQQDNEIWSYDLRKAVVIVSFVLSSLLILGSYCIFSYLYIKIEQKKLNNVRYARFINFKQIHLPFDYLKTILKRKDFVFIIIFVSSLTLLNTVSQTIMAQQKEIHPELVIGIKTISVITAAVYLSYRHKDSKAVINVYMDLLHQNILLMISFFTLFFIDYFNMKQNPLKYVITLFSIFILQMNLAILLIKVFLLQHHIFPNRFSFKFFIYGLFRCLQFLIGLTDALLFSRYKIIVIYFTLFIWILQIIYTFVYIKKTSFKKINKLLVNRQRFYEQQLQI